MVKTTATLLGILDYYNLKISERKLRLPMLIYLLSNNLTIFVSQNTPVARVCPIN